MSPSDSLSFKANWLRLMERIGADNPDLSEAESNEVLLTIGTVGVLLEHFQVPKQVVDFVAKNGCELARLILNSSYLNRELQTAAVKLCKEAVLQSKGQRVDKYSLLMQVVHLSHGRRNQRVYYTPRPVARFVVRNAIDQLSGQGLPIDEISILEPSVGTGVFLSAIVDELQESSIDHGTINQVLRNTTCMDISVSAIVVAQILLADQLNEKEIPLQKKSLPKFCVGNTSSAEGTGLFAAQVTMSVDFESIVRNDCYELILGNPPFGSLTESTDSWTKGLLHGEIGPGEGSRSYFKIGESEKINEKKSWLHDDYVKFVRLAHWHAERKEFGCVAFVLNSGFLSNLSFRGMRYQIQDTFKNLVIVDFGGDKRNHRSTDDENIFEIETGIAAMIGSRSNSRGQLDPSQNYTRLTGSRAAKLNWCEQPRNQTDGLDVTTINIESSSPHFFLDRRISTSIKDFQPGLSLDEMFLTKWSVPVSARDHLVVDWTRERLIEKIKRFIAPERTDEEIRRDFFPSPRSNRYPPGDTRSWSVANARRQLQDSNWPEWIRKCAYRPFDQRYVIWHPCMIDWPRGELSKVLDIPGNSCLIARRQAPDLGDYSFFWSSSIIPMDGIIRSDNRGNEYCFPLFTLQDGLTRSNINEELLKRLERFWNAKNLTPETVYFLACAVCHSSEYRQHFREALICETPRIFFPRSLELASELAEFGREIIDCQGNMTIDKGLDLATSETPIEKRSAHRRPRHENGMLTLPNGNQMDLPQEIWEFKIGSHQVLKKYLAYRIQDRLHIDLEKSLGRIAAQIQKFEVIKSRIDERISDSGGLLNAFCMKGIPDAQPNESATSLV